MIFLFIVAAMMTNCDFSLQYRGCMLWCMWPRSQITNQTLNKIAETFACCVNEAAITHCLPLCFHVGGGHTSGTTVFWFQSLFDVDYLDQEMPVEMVWKQEASFFFLS